MNNKTQDNKIMTIKELKAIIEGDFDNIPSTPNGLSIALRLYASAGVEGLVKRLIDETTVRYDDNECEAFRIAVVNNHVDVADYFIKEHGIDVSVKDNWTISYASKGIPLELISVDINGLTLVSYRELVIEILNAIGWSITAHEIALTGGVAVYRPNINQREWDDSNTTILNMLIDNGADISVRGNEPVRWASVNNRLYTVALLCGEGADITDGDNWAFRGVCGRGHTYMIRTMVDNGLDLKECSAEGIQVAQSNGHYDTAEYIRNLASYIGGY